MWAFGISKDKIKKVIDQPFQGRMPSQGIEKFEVEKPVLKSDEVLIQVKASALNYNSLWSSLCHPLTPTQLISSYIQRNPSQIDHDQDFYIFGSDASGVITEVGESVKNWSVGDEVVVHCNIVNEYDSIVQYDGMLSESQSIWGYETNYGAFAEFTKVKSSQLIKKPKDISWEIAASYCLTHSTAYRMLISNNGLNIKAGETCLIWGGAGGLGVFAIQLAKLSGANVIAVVSSEEKKVICKNLGADVVFNRKVDFPSNFINDIGEPNYIAWNKVKKVINRKGLGEIDYVFEHIGRQTLGLSTYLLKRGGKIVICAATSGYLATIDLRFLWMQLKSIVGSHFANYHEAQQASNLIFNKKIKPVIYKFSSIDDLPKLMDDMYLGKTHGKIVFNHDH